MATCKEDNDQVDGYRVARSSSQSSDDCTLDNGNHSDGESGDSSSSSVTDSTDGIHVVIHYKRKVANRLMDFNRPQFIPLSFEQYLKWQFIHWNPTWRQDKILKLQKIAEKAVITGELAEIFLGKQTNDPNFDRLVEDIKQILLSNTDSIVISWFPLKASYADTDIYKILTGNIQQSGLGMKQEIFTDLTDTHLIRCVHEEKHKAKVDKLISKSLLDYTKKQKQGFHSMKQKLPLVFHQIFESNNVKKEAHKAFPAVSVFFDVIESEDELAMKLKGPINNIQDIYEWIKDKYIDPYVCEELNFDEIEHSDEVLDVSSVVYETLETNAWTGLYWYINKCSKNVLLCSLSRTDVNNAVQTAKQSIKKLQKQMKHIQIEDAELMIRDLMDLEEANGGTVSVTAMASRDEIIICCIGCQDKLSHLEKWFDAYRQTTLEISTDNPSQCKGPKKDIARGIESPLDQTIVTGAEGFTRSNKEGETKSLLEVTVIIGQLNGIKADVIVNTTGREIRLERGRVSASLLQSAGPGLQEEVIQKRPNGIEYGEIVRSYGYNLRGCQHVLHGALCSYNGPQNLKGLQKFVFDCLMETETLECQSIAFPAIGTGILGYPKAEVAKAMFRAVKAFEGRRHFVNEVRFVVYHRDPEAVKEFQKEEEHYAKYCKSHSQDLKTIGQVGVMIKQGTLADIATEGILYIWERHAAYNARVGDHELLKLAGFSVQMPWIKHRDDRHIRLRPLRTPGGDIGVSHIIHVFSEDSTQGFQEALLTGFRQADDLASVTVYFSDKSPFLKYGQQLIDAFVQSILDIKKTKTGLRTIHLVLESKNKNLVPKFMGYLEHNDSLHY